MKIIDRPETVKNSRPVEQVVKGLLTSDGAGVTLTRVIHQPLQHRLDPFLMLDAFGSDNPDDYIAGFPDHPHRGFETVTYMLTGRMRHRDSAGHEGLLQSGGMQWMTAGRGVIHSELPEQEHGTMEGFQLWLNLPAAKKMSPAWYRDVAAEDIPAYTTASGVAVKVIAGTSNGIAGAIEREVTEPLYIDVAMPESSQFDAAIPATHNAFVYVYRGAIAISGRTVEAGRMAILDNLANADGVAVTSGAGAKFILVAGRPLKEPIVQYGPFVMNTKEEIFQAIGDFREGQLVN